MVEALERQQMRQKADRLAAGEVWTDTGLVFTTALGTMLDPSNTRRYFRQLTERAGLGPWHPHEARHSAVSLLSSAGVPLEPMEELFGPDDG